MGQLISEKYRDEIIQKMLDDKEYGCNGKRFANQVLNLSRHLQTKDILDYGCGKGTLQQNLPFLINQYDPCIKDKSIEPKAAQIVTVINVIENVEKEFCENVLEHIRALVNDVVFFAIEITDNKCCYVEWFNKIAQYFTISSLSRNYIVDRETVVKEDLILIANLKKGD